MLARRCMAESPRVALHQSPLSVRVRECVSRATGATCSPKAKSSGVHSTQFPQILGLVKTLACHGRLTIIPRR